MTTDSHLWFLGSAGPTINGAQGTKRFARGSIAEQVKEVFGGGVDKVLELLRTTSPEDSLLCAKQRGIVCMTGIVGNKWSFEDFSPMSAIPSAVNLTTYAGESEDFMMTPLQELVAQSRRARCRPDRQDVPSRRDR